MASTELADLNEETDEYTETTSKLRDLVKGLTGFDIMKDKDNFKDIYEIILGIGEKWDSLTDVEQASLGEALAGKRNANALYAVLGNLDTLQDAYKAAENSAGSAAREQENYAKSIQYSIDQNIASLQELARDFLSSDLLKSALEFFNDLLKSLDKIVEKTGSLSALFVLIPSIALMKGDDIIQTVDALGNIFDKLKNAKKVSDQVKGAAKATGELAEGAAKATGELVKVTSATAKSSSGLAGLASTLGVSTGALTAFAVAAAAVAAVIAGAIAWDALTVTVKEAEEDLKKTKSRVEDLKSEIQSLEAIDNRTAEQEIRLQNLKEELALQEKMLAIEEKRIMNEKYGSKFSDHFDKDAIGTQLDRESNRMVKGSQANLIQENEKINNKIEKLANERQEWLDELENPNSKYSREHIDNVLTRVNESYEEALDERENLQTKIESKELEYQEKILEIQQDINSGNLSGVKLDNAREQLVEYKKLLRDIQELFPETKKVKDNDLQLIATNTSYGDVESTYNNLEKVLSQYDEEEQKVWIRAAKNARTYSEALSLGKKAIDELRGSTEELDNSSGIFKKWDLTKQLESIGVAEDDFNAYLNTFKELNPELAKNEELLQRSAVANYKFFNSVNNLTSNLDSYLEALKKNDKNSAEYSETIKTLTNDLTAISGVKFSITDTQGFIKDEENLNLLKNAIDGDSEALKTLREEARERIIFSIDGDEFKRQYEELVNYIKSHSYLSDISINAYIESSDFYKRCSELVDIGRMTKDDMVEIFETMKSDVEDNLPDFAEWKKKTDNAFNFKQDISNLNDLKTALDDVGNAMANVDEHGKFQLGDLDKIADYFIGLDDAAYDVEAVNAAIKLLGEDKGSVEQQAQAINILADNYLRTSNVLDGLNEKNKDLYVLRLKEMGIINAEEIVMASLAGSTATLIEYKEGLIVKDGELVTAEGESIEALIKSGNITEQTGQMLAEYAYQKEYANKKVIDTSADCANLLTLMKTANASVQAIKRIQELKDLLADAENGKIFLSGTRKENIKAKIAEIAKEAMEAVKVDYTQYIPQAKYNGGEPVKNRTEKEAKSTTEALQNSAQKAAEEAAEKAKQEAEKAEKELEDTYDEFFDFFERRVKVCQDGISLLEKHLNNVVGSSAKNKLLDAQARIYKMQQNEYDSAKQLYQQMADQALSKLPQELADKIRNGAINITEFIGEGNKEVVDAINEYTKWADKVQDCKQQLAELKEEIRNLELSRFKNIIQDWQDVFDLQQSNSIDLIDKQIDLLEESGQLIGDSFYKAQKESTEKQISAMEQARRALSAELSKGLSDGTIMKGSSQWQEMVDILAQVEGKLLDAKKAVEQLDNAIINLHVETFERIMDKFDNFDDELSDIGDLLGEMDVADDLGDWTNEGLAQAGLLAQRYELAKKRSAELGDEIKWLNEQYSSGHVSVTEYAERLAELTDEQREAAKTAEDIKDAIVDLNRARIDKEIESIDKEVEAFQRLTDAMLDALKAQKD